MTKNMNSKMTTNSQLSTTDPEKNITKRTTRTGTESQKWRSHRGFSSERRRGKNAGKGTGNKRQKW